MFSLGFVQNWFAPRANPIGVDFGSDCLRLAQVQYLGGEYKLIAAASADVPNHVRHDPAARLAFFVETTRDLLAQGNFRTRQAVLGLPAASMYIQHLRIAKLDEAETRKAIPWEARGKIPIDPSQALLRHVIAGEVYQDSDPKNEVIVMAAAREFINNLLASAAKAKLDVIGMNVEPMALVDCFNHVYRRKSDSDVVNCFLDIGSVGARAIISRGSQIYFARTIPVGGEHFNKATAHAMRINLEEAKLLRIKLCHAQPALDEHREKTAVQPPDPSRSSNAITASSAEENSFALLGAGLQAASRQAVQTAEMRETVQQATGTVPPTRPVDPALEEQANQAKLVEQAVREPLHKLIEELDLCRRYYESTFPSRPVQRLVFVGGEARQRGLCQYIAREMGLAAQVGDPMVRMGRVSEIGIESGIDRRQPQPGWAVAIGLSLGQANVSNAGAAATSNRGADNTMPAAPRAAVAAPATAAESDPAQV